MALIISPSVRNESTVKRHKKRPPPSSAPNLKLTKSESMLRVTKTLKHYSSSRLLSRDDKFKFRFVEGINQLTFQDDERFRDENIFFANVETVPHKHVRDLGCRGLSTPNHVEGQRLRVGDNVNGNFQGRGRWYPAHVTKVKRGKCDLQYSSACARCVRGVIDVCVVCS